MKRTKNKYFLITILMLMMTFAVINVKALSIGTPQKVYSYSSNPISNGYDSFYDDSNNYIISNIKVYSATNYSHIKIDAHFDHGFILNDSTDPCIFRYLMLNYGAQETFLEINYAGGTRDCNGVALPQSTTDGGYNHYQQNTFNYQTKPMIYNNMLPLSGTQMLIVNAYNLNTICNPSFPLTSNPGVVIANDPSYIYYYFTNSALSSVPYRYYVLDYNCNIVMGTNENIDGQRLSNYSFIRLNQNNNFFIAVQTNTNKFYTFDTSLAGIGDILDYSSYNITISAITDQCDYDATNNILYCIGKRNGNNDQFDVLAVQLNSYGDFGNVSILNESNFNIPGYDSYSLGNPDMLFIKDNNLYLELYDTIGTTYDLFEITPGNTNNQSCGVGLNYAGLTCYSDTNNICQCFKQNSICLPQNTLDYPADNCISSYINCMGVYLFDSLDTLIYYSSLQTSVPYICKGVYDNCKGTTTSLQTLLSSNYVCNNGLAQADGLYCLLNSSTYCNGGCTNIDQTNIFGVQYVQGNCNNQSLLCDGSCSSQGLTFSDTPISYKQCGFYTSNACLTWSNSIPCPGGQISINGFCQNVNRAGTLTTLRSFLVTPNLTYAQSYSDTFNPPYAKYAFPTVYYSLGFAVSSQLRSYYTARNCNYSESVLYTNTNSVSNINGSHTDSFLQFTGGYTEITLLPGQNTTTEVTGLDNTGKKVYDYYIQMNDSLGACILNASKSIIGCYYHAYNDLQSVLFHANTITQNGNIITSPYLSLKYASGGGNSFFVTWDNQIDNLATNYYSLVLNGTNYSFISDKIVNAETESANNGFLNWVNTSNNDYHVNPCVMSTLGTRTVRTYYSDTTDGVLWDYKDWTITVNGLGNMLLVPSTSNTNTGLKLTPDTKLLLGIIIPLVVFLLTIACGFAFPGEGIKNLFLFIGVFFGVGLLAYFSINGWLPGWLIFLMFIVAGGVVAFVVRSIIVGPTGE